MFRLNIQAVHILSIISSILIEALDSELLSEPLSSEFSPLFTPPLLSPPVFGVSSKILSFSVSSGLPLLLSAISVYSLLISYVEILLLGFIYLFSYKSNSIPPLFPTVLG